MVQFDTVSIATLSSMLVACLSFTVVPPRSQNIQTIVLNLIGFRARDNILNQTYKFRGEVSSISTFWCSIQWF
jgi:hypothetical protein